MITVDGIYQRLGALACLAFLATISAGCDEAKTAVAEKPLARPVSYITLKASNPSRQARVTGSVAAWKKEMVSFQVEGRVRYAREPGSYVEGRLVDDNGTVLEPGALIAELENERYKLRLAEAEANVATLEAQAQVVKADIEEAVPSEIREVQAEYDRAKTEFERQRRLLKVGAGAQSFVDTARSQFKAAEARLAQLGAKRTGKTAELNSAESKVEKAIDEWRQAQLDLDDTQLFSAFSGQISKIHVNPGGYVERGQPVATVQMMDPMKVEIAVSAKVDEQIKYNDLMKVYVAGAKEPLLGWVWLRDTVADATTRTFTVTLLVRNAQDEMGLREPLEDKPVVSTSGLWNLESEHDNGHAPFFVNARTLHQDAQGHFVWQAKGLTVSDLEGDFNPVFKVKKVRVTPGDRHKRLLGTFTYRQLDDIGELDPDTALLASDLPPTLADGTLTFLARKRWRLRPGQLVEVDLNQGRMPEGLYVPAQTVIENATGAHVFKVEPAERGEQRATKVSIELGPQFGTLQAISARGDGKSPGALAEGAKLVLDGAHYINDGELINAFDEVEHGQ